MNIEKVKEVEHIILNPKTDKCPLCETPLTNVSWSWRIFHGEAKSSCCGMICQIKSYHVDESKPEERAFAESLDNPERIEFCIKKEWIDPLRLAMKDLLINDVNNDSVYKRAKEIKESK